MRLILTRHGETIENKKGINQGWLPGHLSGLGKKQAKLVALRLRNLHIDIIYCSDLNRCLETANEIKKYHKNSRFIKENRLRERCTGIFQGTVVNKSDWDILKGDLYTNKPKGGESFVEMWGRLKDFYKDLLENTDETILVIGHGGSICLLHGLISGKDLKYSLTKIEKLKNTAITEFKVDSDGSFKLLVLNSEEHLIN
jgi:probable phosphoglycerate mutase